MHDLAIRVLAEGGIIAVEREDTPKCFRLRAFIISIFSETDFTEDLKKFDVPTLVLHGDVDQIVPIGASAMLSSKLIKGATLKVYPGAPHSLCSTHKDQVNADLLAFFKA